MIQRFCDDCPDDEQCSEYGECMFTVTELSDEEINDMFNEARQEALGG